MRVRGRAVVARRAHNPEVVGSNPSPATEQDKSVGLSFFVSRNCLVSLSINSNTALIFLVRNDFPSYSTFSGNIKPNNRCLNFITESSNHHSTLPIGETSNSMGCLFSSVQNTQKRATFDSCPQKEYLILPK